MLPEPVAVALDVDDPAVVKKPVEDGGGQFREPPALGSRSHGAVMLDLRSFKLSQHIQPAVDISRGEHIPIGRKQVGVASEL